MNLPFSRDLESFDYLSIIVKIRAESEYERKIETRIETHVNRTGRWVRVHQRGSEEPEKVRLQREVTELLEKRQTGLADALDALTALILNVLGKRYGEKDEFDKLAFRFSDEVSSFLEPTERDLPVGRLIPVEGPRGSPIESSPFHPAPFGGESAAETCDE